MKTSRVIAAIIGLLIVLPISLYLQYKILHAVNASELMWFLFWIYVPAIFVVQLIFKLAEEEKK